jgi:hypothetical protein
VNGGARAALALALGSLVLYNANVRETSSQDTVPARVLPHEVIRSGRLDLDRLFREWPAGAPLPFYAQRAGEHYRSSYPVAPALLAVPVYAAPILLGAGDSWVVLNALSKLAASLFAALSVAVVYLAARDLARRLGTGEASALGAAVVYAVATPTWAVSSQGLWGHAPAQLGLAVALWALLRGDAGPDRFASDWASWWPAGPRPPWWPRCSRFRRSADGGRVAGGSPSCWARWPGPLRPTTGPRSAPFRADTP